MACSRQDVYARHLASDRGYPLWTPEPNMNLPETYHWEGLKIGDVGVVVPRNGSFDVFFNLCLDPTHALHREKGVPANFTPIPLGKRDVSDFPDAENAPCVISPLPIVPVEPSEGLARSAHPGHLNYQFTSSSREGAVLILPEGAARQCVLNEDRFRDEAMKHAVEWYTFVKQHFGSHDSLYLITGFHKALSWSSAVYQRGQDAGRHEASVRFRTVRVDGNDPTEKYSWDPAQGMSSHSGPSYYYYRHGIPNQAVFIEGFTIAVRESMLGLLKWVKVAADSHSEQPNHAESSWSPQFPNPFWGGGGSTADPPRENNPPGSNPAASGSGDVCEGVEISRFPQVKKPFHPSDIINQYLLQQVPSANVAITHDSVWTTLVAKGLLSREELSKEDCLIAAVKSNYPTVLELEGVTLTENDTDEAITTPKIHPPVAAFESRSLHRVLWEEPSPPDLTATLDLNTKRILATGSFSVVYRCKSYSQDKEVAVKAIVFPPGFEPAEKKEFARKVRRELELWRRLDHPNIIPLLGTTSGNVFGSNYPCIVSMLTPNGTLYEYVERRGITLPLPDRIKFIKGSTTGLQYLHSRGIIHGDFHPGNILIDGDHSPRLTDFGLSQTLCQMPAQLSYLFTHSIRTGAMMWAAPELVYPELYQKLKFQATLHGDVYSLGSIILFILSGNFPWKDRDEAQKNLKRFQNPPRPTWPANIPDGVWDFIEQCWSPRNPGSRPSAQEVLLFSTHKLKQLLQPNLPSDINVVLFGALGSGKSSIINLLAEKDIAPVSSGGKPCTERPRSYQIAIANRNFRLWDTMGFSLQEGSASNLLPYEHAHAVLRNVPEGVSLILLCADKGKITSSLHRFYWLVNNFFYGGCAPIAFVVTHCDTPDENWWKNNKYDIAKRTTIPTQSIPYACVTTDPAGCDQSKHVLKELVKTYATAVTPFPLRLDFSLDLATHCRLSSSDAATLVEKFRRPLRTFNVVFFGEPGSGASEIFHILVEHSVAGTSTGTISYPRSYAINTGMRRFRIWESTDVDAPHRGSDVCGREELIRDSSGEGGVDLLVLCKRFSRLTLEGLDIDGSFAKAIGEGSPAAVIITHFDSPNPMEEWWEMNGKGLIKSLGGNVIGHACIPPLASSGLEGDRLDKTLLQSRFVIHDMLEDCASSRHFSPPGGIKEIYKNVMGKIHRMAMPVKSPQGSSELTRKRTL